MVTLPEKTSPSEKKVLPLVSVSVCAECAANGQDCCHAVCGGVNLRFPLSASEIELLHPFAETMRQPGQATDWFYCTARNSKDFFKALCALFPGEEESLRQMYPVGGERYVLAMDENATEICTGKTGADKTGTGKICVGKAPCVFIGPSGCRLPREVRPWHCRLFPLWERKGKVRLVEAHSCMAVSRAVEASSSYAKRLELVLHMLDTDLNNGQELYRNLRSAWGLDRKS